MKDILKNAIVNIILFAVFYVGFFITIFLLGYGSNNTHLNEQWIVYSLFFFLHVLTFFFVLRLKHEFRVKTFLLFFTLIVIVWSTMGLIYGQ